MSRYTPGPVPVSGDIGQLQRFLRGETQRIQAGMDLSYTAIEDLSRTLQTAAYGQIGLDAVTPLANIGAAWQRLPFDVDLIAEPRGVTYDIAGDGMALDDSGVWKFNAKVSLEFLEAQAGRRMQLSLWDNLLNAPVGPLFNFSIGRNTDGANLAFSIMFEVTDATRAIGLAVASSTDTFTGVSAIGSIFGVNYQSEYQGDVLDRETGAKTRWQ